MSTQNALDALGISSTDPQIRSLFKGGLGLKFPEIDIGAHIANTPIGNKPSCEIKLIDLAALKHKFRSVYSDQPSLGLNAG